MEMKDKVVMVTGGAQGIGKTFCQYLLKNGAKVIMIDIKESVGQKAVQELRNELGDNVVFYQCDVTDSKQLEGCFERTIKEFGGLDIVINNAAILSELESGWRKMIEVNMIAPIVGTKLGFKYMSKANGGKGGMVINTGSNSWFGAFDCLPVYSSIKAAINQMSRSFGTALHYKNSGVKVICINPGHTVTDMAQNILSCLPEESAKRMPESMKRMIPQGVDNMGKGLIQVIKTAENGSLWTIEAERPAEPTVWV